MTKTVEKRPLTELTEAQRKGWDLNITPKTLCLRASVRAYFVFLFFVLFFGFPVFAQNPAQPVGQPVGQSGKTLSLDETLGSLAGSGAGTPEFRWDPFFASGTLTVGGHEAAFASGRAGETGMVLLDRKDVLTLPLPYPEKGNIRFPETFVGQIKNTLIRYVEEDRSRFRIAVIVIDPGHGGKDEGTAWNYQVQGKTERIKEKDIVLKVSRQLHASLKAAFPDKRVLLTREGDTNPSKDDRVDMANSLPLKENEAAIFISVHANSSLSNRNARGFEVWYLSPSYRRDVIDRSRYSDAKEVIPILNTMLEEELTTESIILANYILKRLDEKIGKESPSRGLKAEEWFVVRNAKMPSVLVELGFVSNREEALLMTNDAYLKNLSEALYKGITDFVTFFERAGGFTITP